MSVAVNVSDTNPGGDADSKASPAGNTSIGESRLPQRFAKGSVIVTLTPANSVCSWMLPAKFRPDDVPKELMIQGLTLSSEDYITAMEQIVYDSRFQLYNIFYKRCLLMWYTLSLLTFVVLLVCGFSRDVNISVFTIWVVLNIGATFACMSGNNKLIHNLERCLGEVNKSLVRHRIVVAVNDIGKIRCTSVHIAFIYFDITNCIKKLEEVIEGEEREWVTDREESREERKKREKFQMRMELQDATIQDRGSVVLARYLQRWAQFFLHHRLDWTIDASRGNPYDPRHLSTALCPCQYVEKLLKYGSLRPRVY